MITNASLLEEMQKDRQEAIMPRPTKSTGTKAVLSKGVSLGVDTQNTYDMAMGVKSNIEYLKDDTSEGGSRALGVTAATTGLTATGADLGKKVLQKKMKGMAGNILSGDKTKNITDIVNTGSKVSALGKVAGGLGAIASVASFGKQVYDTVESSSALNTGRGFESAGDKVTRGASLGAGAVGATAAVGSAVGAITGAVATTNFWNPVGWIAAAVGLVASGIGWLANKSKIRGSGRFTGRFKPGGYLSGR